MITIARRVEQLIEQWPLLKQGLELDLLNTSAVARYLKPEIEKEIGERISEAAVLMALRRYEQKRIKEQAVKPQNYLGDMSLRSDLVDLTYSNSPTLERRIGRMLRQLDANHFTTVSRGLLQTSLIIHQNHNQAVQVALQRENLEKETTQLTAITLHLRQGHDRISGILAYPLQLLSWKGISVVELVSTYDELNIVVYKKDVELAFSTLHNALK